jgi:hypothetical protein
MISDILLIFISLGAGVLIGYNLKHSDPVSLDDVSKENEKLKQELSVYKNLKESLLTDVRYWRNKAGGK